MGISPIGDVSYLRQAGAVNATRRIDALPDKELTTVKNDCQKKHKHTPACPNTASTKPSGRGEPGKLLDVYA